MARKCFACPMIGQCLRCAAADQNSRIQEAQVHYGRRCVNCADSSAQCGTCFAADHAVRPQNTAPPSDYVTFPPQPLSDEQATIIKLRERVKRQKQLILELCTELTEALRK